jgi:hypothetical protein
MPAPGLITLLLFAVGAGAFGALIGAGGGFLIVPALVFAFGRTPQEAVGITALAVLLICTTATISYLPRRRVDGRVALATALPGVPAAIAGTWLLARLAAGPGFSVALGAMFLVVAAVMLRSRSRAGTAPPVSLPAVAMGGGVVGAITGTFAAGGGLLTVPMLMRWGGLSASRATATTAMAMLPSAAIVAAAQVWRGHVPPSGFAVAIAAAIGARGGALWSGRWGEAMLVVVTAAAVAAVGVATLARAAGL